MLNCTSICGASCQEKLCGAFGFSTERSLIYWETMPAAGPVSAPLPRLRSEMTLPSSAIGMLSRKENLCQRARLEHFTSEWNTRRGENMRQGGSRQGYNGPT